MTDAQLLLALLGALAVHALAIVTHITVNDPITLPGHTLDLPVLTVQESRK